MECPAGRAPDALQHPYRYYTLDQLPRLHRILALKDLGLSLDQIGALLRCDLSAEQLREMLQKKRAEVEARVKAEGARLARVEARLRQIETEADVPDYDVVLKKIQPKAEDPECEACRGLKRLAENAPPPPGTFEIKLEAPAGEPPPGPWGMLKREAPAMEDRLLFFVGGPPPADPRDLRPGADDGPVVMPFVEAHTLPGVETAATVIHEGDRDSLVPAVRALVRWVEQNGYRVAGHYQENVLREAGEGKPPMFELLLPVVKA